MSDLNSQVIDAGWALRKKGIIVDRQALIKATGHDDGPALMLIWQQHIQSSAAQLTQSSLLKTEIETFVTSLSDSIANEKNKLQSEAETLLEQANISFTQQLQSEQAKSNLLIDDIASLKEQLAELQKTDQEEKNIIDDLTSQVSQLEHELVAQQEETRAASELNVSITQQLAELSQTQSTYEQEQAERFSALKNEHETTLNEQRKQQQQHDELVANAQQQIEDLNKQVNNLNVDLEQLDAQNKQLIEQQAEQLKYSQDESKQKIAELLEELAESNKLVVDLQTNIHIAEQSEHHLANRVLELEHTIEEQEQSNEQLIQAQDKYQSELKELREAYTLHQQESVQFKESAHLETSELKEENQALNTLNNQLSAQLQHAQEQYTQIDVQSKAEIKAAQLAFEQECQSLQASVNNSNEQIIDLKDQLNRLTKQEQDATNQLNNLQAENQALTRMQDTKDDEIGKLTQQLSDFKTLSQQTLNEEKQKNVLLSDTLAELESQQSTSHSQYRNKIDTLEQEIHRLTLNHEHEIKALNAQIVQAERHFGEEKQAHVTEEAKVVELSNQLKEQESERKKLQQVMDRNTEDLSRQLHEAQEKIHLLEESNLQLKSNVSSKSKKQEEEEDRIRETIRDLRHHIHQLEQQYVELEHDSQQQLTEYRLKFEYAQRQLQQSAS